MSKNNWQQRNQYKGQGSQKVKLLQWNSHGIFFTCEFERDGVREANNLISKFLDEASGSERQVGEDKIDNEELDIADQLKKAVEEANKPKNARRVRQQPTGINHCLFFEVDELPRDKVTEFVENMVDKCQNEQQCRFLQRAIPVEDVSSDDPVMLRNKLRRILDEHFARFKSNADNDGKHATFAVDFKARFTNYKRQDALDLVCDIVQEIDPESKVNLTEPNLTIIFHVLKKAVLLSCVRNFNQRRKMALRPPGVETKDETVAKSAAEVPVNDNDNQKQELSA